MFAVSLAIPESPRWLAVQARYDEVTRLLKKMCRANKRELPADFDAKCLADAYEVYYHHHHHHHHHHLFRQSETIVNDE